MGDSFSFCLGFGFGIRFFRRPNGTSCRGNGTRTVSRSRRSVHGPIQRSGANRVNRSVGSVERRVNDRHDHSNETCRVRPTHSLVASRTTGRHVRYRKGNDCVRRPKEDTTCLNCGPGVVHPCPNRRGRSDDHRPITGFPAIALINVTNARGKGSSASRYGYKRDSITSIRSTRRALVRIAFKGNGGNLTTGTFTREHTRRACRGRSSPSKRRVLRPIATRRVGRNACRVDPTSKSRCSPVDPRCAFLQVTRNGNGMRGGRCTSCLRDARGILLDAKDQFQVLIPRTSGTCNRRRPMCPCQVKDFQ